MYYRFRKNYIRTKRQKRPLTSFGGLDEGAHEDNLPIKYVSSMRGVTTRDGRLVSNLGISALKPINGGEYEPTQFEIDNIYPFYLDGKRELIVSSNHRAFRLDDEYKRWRIIPNTFFSGRNSAMFTVGEEPCIIIPREGAGLYNYNGGIFRDMGVSYTPITMTPHMNRLYLVDENDPYRLRFSAINDPSNFALSLDGGGEIYLDVEDGKIVRLISYGGNLYIFREYGIYRLTAYADQRDFSVKKIATTTTKIDGDSVAMASGRMVMRTQDGLYTFDGYNITRVLRTLDSTLEGITVSEGCYFNGSYYLSYGKEAKKTHLLRWNMVSGDVTLQDNVNIRKFSIIRSTTSDECLAVAVDNIRQVGVIDDSFGYFDNDVVRYWRSDAIDFGVRDKKSEVVGFYVKDSDRYTLEIDVDGTKHTYEVDGSKRYYHVGYRGYTFRFTIIPSGVAPIFAPVIEYKV